MQKLYFFLVLMLVIVSCKQDTQQEKPKSYFCSPQLEALFSGDDSLPVIEFKHDNSFAVIKELLHNKLDTQQYFNYFKINLSIDSTLKPLQLAVFTENLFFTKGVWCGSNARHNYVIINSDGLYLVDGELGDTSTIRTAIIKNITNNGKEVFYSSNPKRAFVSIGWDYTAPKVQFDAVIKAITNGYIEVINDEALKKYNKEFCLLTPFEATEILNNYNFRLELVYQELKYQKFALDTIY